MGRPMHVSLPTTPSCHCHRRMSRGTTSQSLRIRTLNQSARTARDPAAVNTSAMPVLKGYLEKKNGGIEKPQTMSLSPVFFFPSSGSLLLSTGGALQLIAKE